MKDTMQPNKNILNEIRYDPALDVYADVVLFPKKLALATAILENYVLFQKNKLKQPQLTDLQAELLGLCAREATEKQVKKLNSFLFYLHSDEIYGLDTKKTVKDSLSFEKKRVEEKEKSILLQPTPFQTELLDFFVHEPTDKQMLLLKDFLAQLFKDENSKVEVEEMAIIQ